ASWIASSDAASSRGREQDFGPAPDDEPIYASIPDTPIGATGGVASPRGRTPDLGPDPEQEPIYESIPGIPTGAVGGAASPRSRTPDLGPDPEQEPIYESIPGIPTGAVGGVASPRGRTPDLGPDPEQEPIYESIPGIPTGAVGGVASPRGRTPDLGPDPEQEPIYESIPGIPTGAVGGVAPTRGGEPDLGPAPILPARVSGFSDGSVRPKVPSRPKIMKQAAIESDSESSSTKTSDLSDRPIRPKVPPRPKIMKQAAIEESQKVAGESTHAETGSKKSRHTKAKKIFGFWRKRDEHSEGRGHPSPSPLKPPRVDIASPSLSERDLLCAAFRAEIRHLCKSIYGDTHILDRQLEEAQRNPAKAEVTAVYVLHDPKAIGSLSGFSVLGMKSSARKAAERDILFLSEVLKGYANAQKSANELREPVNAKQQLKPLSRQEMDRQIRTNPEVQYAHTKIQVLCKQVFGTRESLDFRLEDVRKIPGMADELIWQVQNFNSFFGGLRGQTICGIKTSARKDAEKALPILCENIKEYGEKVVKAKEDIVQSRQSRVELHDKFLQRSQKLENLQKERSGIAKQSEQEVLKTPQQKFATRRRAMSASI
uniref:BID domain-containing T4SS effector n=1 Tax=Bartonella phoceensis TaxID=270249 RepID=UPI001ABB3A6E